MAISAYVGLPGHGKSYGVVKHVILPALKNKRTVFTNIPINKEICLEEFECSVVQFDMQDIIDNEDWWSTTFEAGAILVIDEVWRLWPQGLKASAVRESDRSFLAEHRHLVGENNLSTEVILVTQDLGQLCSFAKNLVENTFRVVKLGAVGLGNRYRVDVFQGPVSGPNPNLKNRIKEIQGGKFKADIYRLYKSHTKSETGEAGCEKSTDSRNNALKSGKTVGFVFVLIFCMWFSYYGLSTVYRTFFPADVNQEILKDLKKDGQLQTGSNINGFSQIKNTDQLKSGSVLNKLKPVEHTINYLKLEFEYLSEASSYSIVFNMGNFPNIKYLFRVVIGNTVSDLTVGDLISLGYKVKPINNCLVRVAGADFNSFLACENSEQNKKNDGFVSNLITAN